MALLIGYHLTYYNYTTATYNRSITNETSNIIYNYVVHYELLNLAGNLYVYD